MFYLITLAVLLGSFAIVCGIGVVVWSYAMSIPLPKTDNNSYSVKHSN